MWNSIEEINGFFRWTQSHAEILILNNNEFFKFGAVTKVVAIVYNGDLVWMWKDVTPIDSTFEVEFHRSSCHETCGVDLWVISVLLRRVRFN